MKRLPLRAASRRIKLRGSDNWKELKTQTLLRRAERERLVKDAEDLAEAGLKTHFREIAVVLLIGMTLFALLLILAFS